MLNEKCTMEQTMLSRKNEKLYIPVNVLASSLSILVPSLVETQVKCRGSTSRSPVREVKLPSAAAQLLIFPFPEKETCICTVSQCFLHSDISIHEVSKGTTKYNAHILLVHVVEETP